MSILTTLLTNVEAVQSGLQNGTIVREVVSGHPDDVLELQRIQLLEGKTPTGEDIRPYYSEDLKPEGHFHSVESAGRYAAWKDGLSYPYSVERNPDAPNLYINGKFHSEIDVDFREDAAVIVPGTGYAEGIMLKYPRAFGLSQESWNAIFSQRGALAELMETIKGIIYEY